MRMCHGDSHLFTCQSIPAVKASLSSAPKHTSSTGARCSYFSISFPPSSSLAISYRYACLSHEDTSNRVGEPGANLTAETASVGGCESSYWIAEED